MTATETPLTLADLATIAVIAGTAFGVLRFLFDYLSTRWGSKMTVAEQPERCHFDHSQINKLITTQNANIAKMLEQNGEQIKALSDANHAAQLRHQIVLNEFAQTRNEIDKIVRAQQGGDR